MMTGILFQFVWNKTALLFVFVIFFILEPYSNSNENSISDAPSIRTMKMHQNPNEDISETSAIDQNDETPVQRSLRMTDELPLTYHSEKVKFLHSAVGLLGNDHTRNHGLLARKHVSFGSILGTLPV